jgi:hypothetical protein
VKPGRGAAGPNGPGREGSHTLKHIEFSPVEDLAEAVIAFINDDNRRQRRSA